MEVGVIASLKMRTILFRLPDIQFSTIFDAGRWSINSNFDFVLFFGSHDYLKNFFEFFIGLFGVKIVG